MTSPSHRGSAPSRPRGTPLAALFAAVLFLSACGADDRTATDGAADGGQPVTPSPSPADDAAAGGGDLLAGVDMDADFCESRRQIDAAALDMEQLDDLASEMPGLSAGMDRETKKVMKASERIMRWERRHC